jgi:CBS domain-containing protein
MRRPSRETEHERPPPSGVRLVLQVRDVMSWPAAVVMPDTPAGYAATAAVENGFHHFPVVERGKLVGVICTCDLADADPRDGVGTCMTEHPVTVPPHATLAEAHQTMEDHGVDCLVASWLDAWGIITRGDLVRAGVCDDHDRPQCTACGARHHVRPAPRSARRWLCIDCMDDEEVDELYRDWGDVD